MVRLIYIACINHVSFVDINECADSSTLNDCMYKEYCRNTVGTHECDCPNKYSGNGKAPNGCIKIDDGTSRGQTTIQIIIGKFITCYALYFLYGKPPTTDIIVIPKLIRSRLLLVHIWL